MEPITEACAFRMSERECHSGRAKREPDSISRVPRDPAAPVVMDSGFARYARAPE